MMTEEQREFRQQVIASIAMLAKTDEGIAARLYAEHAHRFHFAKARDVADAVVKCWAARRAPAQPKPEAAT